MSGNASAQDVSRWFGFGLTGEEDWDVQNLLGEGQYGTVHKMVDGATGRVAACKMPVRNGYWKCKQEAKVMLGLDHPNVLRLMACVCTDDIQYSVLVLEFCSGGDARELITKAGGLQHRHAFRLSRQLLDGVQYLQDNKIAHRDLKLENILLASNDTLKIADFNSAEYYRDPVTGEEVLATEPNGTRYVMAPEMFRDMHMRRGVCQTSLDSFAIGVILVYFMTGQEPWSDCLGYDKNFTSWLEENWKVTVGKAPVECLNYTHELWRQIDPMSFVFLHRMMAERARYRFKNATAAKDHPWFKANRRDLEDDDVFEYSDERTDTFVKLRNEIRLQPAVKIPSEKDQRRHSSSVLEPGRARSTRLTSYAGPGVIVKFRHVQSVLSVAETAQLLKLGLERKGFCFHQIGKTGFLVKKVLKDQLDFRTRVDVFEKGTASEIAVQVLSGTDNTELTKFVDNIAKMLK